MTTLTKEAIFSQLESTDEFPILLSEVWEWIGYTRKDNAKRAILALGFVEGIDLLIKEEATTTGISAIPSEEISMTIDCFKLWAMSAQTAKGKEVRLYYLQVEKEWKAGRVYQQPEISPDHIEAHSFRRDVFSPFKLNNPIAAKIFLDWEGLKPVTVAPSSTGLELPTDEMQKALNGAFLNLNRSGLAMNKLFHFVDRIPTMNRMSEDAIKDLTEALIEASETISNLKRDLEASRVRSASEKGRAESLYRKIQQLEEECKAEREDLQSEIEDLSQKLSNLKNRTTSKSANAKIEARVESIPKHPYRALKSASPE